MTNTDRRDFMKTSVAAVGVSAALMAVASTVKAPSETDRAPQGEQRFPAAPPPAPPSACSRGTTRTMTSRDFLGSGFDVTCCQ